MAIPENFLPSSQGQANSITVRDFDLSIARQNVETNVPGFSFMSVASEAFDANGNVTYSTSTGVMLMALENSSAAKLLVKSGFEFNVEACNRLYLTNVAQPGKMLRVYFATYPFVHQVPQFNAQPTQSNVVPFGASGVTVQGNAGVQTLLAPGANLTGIILRSVAYFMQAGYSNAGLYLDTAAPSGPFDATKRSLFCSNNTSQAAPANIFLMPNLSLQPGVGIYFASSGALGVLSASWDPL